MRPQDLVVEVRDVTMARQGVILPQFLDLKATLRDVGPSEWTLRLPASHPMAAQLRKPGGGLVVSHADRTIPTLLSGPADPVEEVRATDDPNGTLTVTGTDDRVLAYRRQAHPNPANAPTVQPAGWDVRSGTAEAVMGAYMAANMGAGAYPERRVPGFSVAESLGRGGQVKRSARFDYLGDLLDDIAAQAGLGWRLVQQGEGLVFTVVDRRDQSGPVRLDLTNGTLASMAATVHPPTLTHATVAGQGDGGARTLVYRTTPAGDPWGPWGRREAFLDQRNTNDPDELAQAGDKALLEAIGQAGVTLIPGAMNTMRWPQDWDRGDTVGVIVGRLPLKAPVTEVLLAINQDGVKVGATLGTSVGWTPNADLKRRADALERRLSALERNSPTSTVSP